MTPSRSPRRTGTSRDASRAAARALGVASAAFGVSLFAPLPAFAINTVTNQSNIAWQVNDAAMPGVDTGSIRQITGNSLLSYGGIRVSVSGAKQDRLDGELLRGFGMKFDGLDEFATTTPVHISGVDVSRNLKIERSANWARFVDSYTNRTSAPITVEVSFGGIMGQSSDTTDPATHQAQQARVMTTASGDQTITSADAWVAVGTPTVAGAFTGPTTNGSSATVLGSPGSALAGSLVRTANQMRDPFSNLLPGTGHEGNFFGYLRRITLAPGETKSIAQFVVVSARDTVAGGPNLQSVTSTAAALAASPDFTGLSTAELCTIANWSLAAIDSTLPATCATVQPPQPERAPTPKDPVTTSKYDVVGKTITELQADLRAGKTTSQQITRAYLDRIAAYDTGQRGLHAFIHVADDAMEQAKAADIARAKGKDTDLLGIPVAVKDLYDTKDQPTTNGSLVFEGFRPTKDAFQVAQMREAGAVILGKANMSEFANSGRHSESPWGQVWNAIQPSATSQGSSGGSGVAVAASFAGFAMGSQTGVSLNAPSGASSLVALRGTDGMSSGGGVMPLNWLQDYAGPMARSVSDLATVLNFTTGTDPDEPRTAEADSKRPEDWKAYLKADALAGKTIGYIPATFGSTSYGTTGSLAVANAALDEMRAMGATLVPVSAAPSAANGPSTPGTNTGTEGWARWLEAHPEAPYKTPLEIQTSQKKLPYNRSTTAQTGRMSQAQYEAHLAARAESKARIKQWMDDAGVDFVVYPNNTSDFHDNDGLTLGGAFATAPASNTGAPEVIVPIGKNDHDHPVSLQLQGRAWDDAKLVGFAYAIEQRLKGHVEPTQFPALPYDASAVPTPIEIEKVPVPETPAPEVETPTNLTPETVNPSNGSGAGGGGAASTTPTPAPAAAATPTPKPTILVSFPKDAKVKLYRAKVKVQNTGTTAVEGTVVLEGKALVRGKSRTVVFGTAKISVKAGTTRTVSVKLNAAGRKQARAKASFKVTASYALRTAPAATTTTSQTLTLRR